MERAKTVRTAPYHPHERKKLNQHLFAARKKSPGNGVETHDIPSFSKVTGPIFFFSIFIFSSPADGSLLYFLKKQNTTSYIQNTCFRSPMFRSWEMVVWYCSEDSICRGGDSNLWRFTLALRVLLPSMYIKHRRCTCIYILPFLSSCKRMLFIWHPAGPTQISSSLSILIFITLSTNVFLRLGICLFDTARKMRFVEEKTQILAFHTGT